MCLSFQDIIMKVKTIKLPMILQAFLDFPGFNFRDFRFTAVYNSILFSSPLVLSNLMPQFTRFLLPRFFCVPTLTL